MKNQFQTTRSPVTAVTSRFGVVGLLGLVGASCLFAGCDGADLFKQAPGEYRGYIAVKNGTKVTQTLVKATIKESSKTELQVKINPQDGSAGEWDFTVDANGKSSGDLKLDGTDLKKTSDKSASTCFSNATKDTPPTVRVCFDGAEFTIDRIDIATPTTVVMDKYDLMPTGPSGTTGQPQSYALSELVDMALNRSFTNEIQVQSVVQAKLNAQMAWAALVPHLTISPLVSEATLPTPNPFSTLTTTWNFVVQNIGNLLPFVFPNRWFQAKEADANYQAQVAAYVVARANAANIVEGLSYAVARDKAAVRELTNSVNYITSIRNMMILREQQNLLELGSSAQIEDIRASVQTTLDGLTGAVTTDLTALSEAVGFVNTNAVSDVQDIGTTGRISDFSISNPPALKQDDVLGQAELRSTTQGELHQLQELLDSARLNKTERYWTWLDPSGGSAGSLGVSLVPYLQVAPSQITQIEAQYQQERSQLDMQVRNLFAQMGVNIAQYSDAAQAIAAQQVSINLTLGDMLSNKTFNLATLASGLSGEVSSKVAQINTEYAYYIALSQVNRVVYAGPYARLSPQDPNSLMTVPPSSVLIGK